MLYFIAFCFYVKQIKIRNKTVKSHMSISSESKARLICCLPFLSVPVRFCVSNSAERGAFRETGGIWRCGQNAAGRRGPERILPSAGKRASVKAAVSPPRESPMTLPPSFRVRSSSRSNFSLRLPYGVLRQKRNTIIS